MCANFLSYQQTELCIRLSKSCLSMHFTEILLELTAEENASIWATLVSGLLAC